MSLDDSFLEDTFKQIEDYSKQKEEKVMLSKKKKPMHERTRGNTDEELESLAKDNLKILLETIEANNISSWIEDRLGIDDNESVEEEKIVNEFAKNPQRLSATSQKCYANQTDKRGAYWSECQFHETLLNRKKRQHLSEDEASHIAQILANHPAERKQIKRLYKLSDSTLRRLSIKTKLIENAEDATKYWSKSLIPMSEKAQRLIKDYLSPPSEPKTISMVKKQLETRLDEIYSEQKIKNFVKKEMRFAYKKGSSRPPKYATRRIQIVKFLFWTELLDLIAKGEVIINIDESSFDRSVKREYSWLPIGQSFPIINERIKGRACLILAIWNTGEWLSMIVSETVESKKFWLFFKILEFVVCHYYQSCNKFLTVIWDNARTHSS